MKKNEKKNRKGSVLTEEDLDLEKAKFRVTFWVDLPVLEKFREFAKASGGKYQTLLNECLNESADEFLAGRAKRIHDTYLSTKKRA